MNIIPTPDAPPANWKDRPMIEPDAPKVAKRPAPTTVAPPAELKRTALDHLRKAYAALANLSRAATQALTQDEAAALQGTLAAGIRLRAALAPTVSIACSERNRRRLPELEPLRFPGPDGRTVAILFDANGDAQTTPEGNPILVDVLSEAPEAYLGEKATQDIRFHIITSYCRTRKWRKDAEGRWTSVVTVEPRRQYAPVHPNPRPLNEAESEDLQHKDAAHEYVNLERGERWKRERERAYRFVIEHPTFYAYRPAEPLASKEERALAVEWLARIDQRLGHRVRPETTGSLGAQMAAREWIQRCRVKVLTDPGPIEDAIAERPHSEGTTEPALVNSLRIEQEAMQVDFPAVAEGNRRRLHPRARPTGIRSSRWKPALRAKDELRARLIETLEAEDARRRDAFLAAS